MGGCASKPKATDAAGDLPVEAPAAETVPQENGNGEEAQKAPLVDLSEPKPEGGDETEVAKSAEPETVTGEPNALASESPVEPTETKVEAAEEKPEGATTEEVTEAVEAKSS